MLARRLSVLALGLIAVAGCGGRVGGWSRVDFERCVGNATEAMSVLGPSDMTSRQMEHHRAIARAFVQVQYVGGEVADIYFASDSGESKAISDRLAGGGTWRDGRVVVDLWSTGETIDPRIQPAIEACERQALNG